MCTTRGVFREARQPEHIAAGAKPFEGAQELQHWFNYSSATSQRGSRQAKRREQLGDSDAHRNVERDRWQVLYIVADNRAFHVEETVIPPSAPVPAAQVQQIQVHPHLSAQAQSLMQGAASAPQAMTGSRVLQPVFVEQTTYEHRGERSSVANGSRSVPIFSGAIAAGGSGQLGGTLATPLTAAPMGPHGANFNAQPSTTSTSLLMARNIRISDDDDTVPLG